MKKMKKKRHLSGLTYKYTLLDEISASTVHPISEFDRENRMGRMRHALKNIVSGESPCKIDWEHCAECVNLMETLIRKNSGTWLDCDGKEAQVVDASGLLDDAILAMANAGVRSSKGKGMRLDGPGIVAVTAVMDDYEDLVAQLPARTIIKAHRSTERRTMEIILYGGKKGEDIHIVDL